MDAYNLYKRLPVSLQNLANDFEGRRLHKERFGGKFREYLEGYIGSQSLSREEIERRRNARLRAMVRYCYDYVPYYKRLFDEHGLSVGAISTPADLNGLPIMTKDDVRRHQDELMSVKRTGVPIVEDRTSGSTGASLCVRMSVDNVREYWAVVWRMRSDLGIALDDWSADFGSKPIVPQGQEGGPYWRYCKPLRQVKFSAFHASNDTYLEYFNEIDDRHLQWISGYPSCIVPFAAFVLENDLHFALPIKAVTVGAENLYGYQRKIIRDAFGVCPRSFYGQTEAVAVITERPDGCLWVNDDYSVVEFVDIPNDPAGSKRIVGTQLSNTVMPLLRYDTADIVIGVHEGDAGRTVDTIDGRQVEYIRLPDGRRVGALSALFTDMDGIREAQLVQHPDYSIMVRYVPMHGDCSPDIAIVRNRLRDRVGQDVSITFSPVDRIPRTASGKLRYIVSECPEQERRTMSDA